MQWNCPAERCASRGRTSLSRFRFLSLSTSASLSTFTQDAVCIVKQTYPQVDRECTGAVYDAELGLSGRRCYLRVRSGGPAGGPLGFGNG